MRRGRLLSTLIGVLLLTGLLQACSPALNWRQVQLQDMRARLPCKPDTATRPVPLGAKPLDLQMLGCEAGGALFAISHVQATDAEAAAKVITQWQAFAMQALNAGNNKNEAWKAPAWSANPLSLRASGKNPNGQPLQARLTWISRGGDVYHLAVYAETITEAMTEPFLEDLQIP